MTYNFRTALPIIEKETIFRSAADDTERRQLYDEYIAELWKAEVEREAAARKEGMEELANLLKSLNLEPYTRWSEAQSIVQNHERFKSEERFQGLTKLDILNTFENHIKQLERAFNDQKQRTKALKMRRERKSREAFVVSTVRRFVQSNLSNNLLHRNYWRNYVVKETFVRVRNGCKFTP